MLTSHASYISKMFFTSKLLTISILTFNVFFLPTHVDGGLTDYLNSVKTYFGYEGANQLEETSLQGFDTKIPYEVSETDEKFISQAIELTGIGLSELDTCQHRLILKLKSDCHTMNDMMIAKLAVGLLNCQSFIEGRKIYPCNEQMTLKQCTSEMDADVWNSYHLMTNRARAVCYSIRQSQFRGLTEHTVNRLMEASHHQIHTLSKIAKDQEDLQLASKETLESISSGHAELAAQQKDLQQATMYGQMQLEDNLKKIADEKRMIQESQEQLHEMTKLLQEKIAEASEQIDRQSEDTSSNHHELLQDLANIQDKAQIIFQKIDESSNKLLEQTMIASRQYEETLSQLKEMNKTVNSLINLVGGTKQALEERLLWIVGLLGGNDHAIDRLYLMVWHFLFLCISMIFCAFMNAHVVTRFLVISTIPLNLALSLLKFEQAADPIMLGVFIIIFGGLQTAFRKGLAFAQIKKERNRKEPITGRWSPIRAITPSVHSRSYTTRTPTPESVINAEISRVTDATDHSTPRAAPRSRLERTESRDQFVYVSPTPPFSRNNLILRSGSRNSSLNSSFKSACSALTRMGTPCKNAAAVGKDVCFRHQKGDSVAR